MHEASIAQSLVEKTLEIAEKNDLIKVNKIKLEIGKLHHIIPEVLENYFNLLKKEYGMLSSTKLSIKWLDIKLKCKTCKSETIINEPFFLCPKCNSPKTEILTGNELHLMRVEGEKD